MRGITTLAVISSVCALAACGGSSKTTTVATSPPAPACVATAANGPAAAINTNFGCIVIALDTTHAPKAAGRFISLAKAKFYDGLTFHRASTGFVIQGGDPKGDGTGGSGKPPVVGEVPKDHYPIGSLAAAKTAADPPGTFDCQFFIVTGPGGSTLPNDYARFGNVVSGMDVAKKIESLAPAGGDGPPTQTVTMLSVTISGA